MLVYLLWLLRGYMALVVVWALLSWIPLQFVGPIRSIIGYAVVPVVNLFSFASFGGISLAAVIVLVILSAAERAVFNKIIKSDPNYDPQDLR
jgi:hypothetical protein